MSLFVAFTLKLSVMQIFRLWTKKISGVPSCIPQTSRGKRITIFLRIYSETLMNGLRLHSLTRSCARSMILKLIRLYFLTNSTSMENIDVQEIEDLLLTCFADQRLFSGLLTCNLACRVGCSAQFASCGPFWSCSQVSSRLYRCYCERHNATRTNNVLCTKKIKFTSVAIPALEVSHPIFRKMKTEAHLRHQEVEECVRVAIEPCYRTWQRELIKINLHSQNSFTTNEALDGVLGIHSWHYYPIINSNYGK